MVRRALNSVSISGPVCLQDYRDSLLRVRRVKPVQEPTYLHLTRRALFLTNLVVLLMWRTEASLTLAPAAPIAAHAPSRTVHHLRRQLHRSVRPPSPSTLTANPDSASPAV